MTQPPGRANRRSGVLGGAQELRASELGADAVAIGAAQHALARVRQQALELKPSGRRAR